MADAWAQTALGAICRFQAGDAFSRDDQGRTVGDHPFIKVSDMNLVGNEIYISRANNWVSDEEVQQNYRLHPKDAVIFAKIGIALTYNRRRRLIRPTVIDNNMMSAVPAPDVDPVWFYYLLSTLDFNLISSGSALPYLTVKDLSRIQIDVPAKREQQAMASILGALDDKIELNRRMNGTLEATARAIFKDWFVDFGPTYAKMEGRPPYLAPDIWSLFPNRLDEEGKPEGWSMTQLDDLLNVLETGGRPKGGVSSYRSGVPSVGAESITGLGEFDFSKTKYVPEEFFKSMKKGHVKSRDVLLYKDGGKPGLFEPHVSLFGDGFPFSRFAINEHVYRMRVQEGFGQNCLYFWLSTEAVKAEMRIKGTGVAIPGLNSTQVRSLSVIVPSNGLAKCLDGILEPLVTRVLANCNEARTLAATRDFLLPKLISGEVRVKGAEKLVGEAT